MLKRISNPEVDAAVAEIVAVATDAAAGNLLDLHSQPGIRVGEIKSACTPFVLELISSLCGPDDYVQATPNLRIHLPDADMAIPFHSDVLYGHSPHETNYWLTLTPAFGTNSLWICDPLLAAPLHDRLLDCADLDQFNETAKALATPVVAETPGLYTFCCSQVHGSARNTTGNTRVSFDIRTIPCNAPQGIKRRGSYFKPKWLKSHPPELLESIPSVATLDYSTPVYLQRQVIRSFCPSATKDDLVEFHGLPDRAPTLNDAMRRGPVVAYTVRQLREVPVLRHALGFADERMWFLPGDEVKLERFWRECR